MSKSISFALPTVAEGQAAFHPASIDEDEDELQQSPELPSILLSPTDEAKKLAPEDDPFAQDAPHGLRQRLPNGDAAALHRNGKEDVEEDDSYDAFSVQSAHTEDRPWLNSACGGCSPGSFFRGSSAYVAETCGIVGSVLGTFRQITFADVLSGLMNGLLFFVFACVFSSMIFADVGLDSYVPMGVAMNTASIFLGGLAFAFFSECAVSMAGPDINPTVFLATMAGIVRDTIVEASNNNNNGAGHAPSAAPHADPPGTSPAPDTGHLRELAGSGLAIPEDQLPPTVVPTILACFLLSQALLGVVFFILGYFRLTRVVQFMPASVLGGFLASVGYLVLLKGIKTAVGHYWYEPLSWEFWRLLLPSLPIGIGLYASKRFHLGKPVHVFPFFVIVPLAIFYAVLFGMGGTIESARAQGWFFEEYGDGPFYKEIVEGFTHPDLVDLSAIGNAMSTMVVMMFVVAIDFLLKLAGTKKSLELQRLSFDREMKLAGKANLLLLCLVGVPAYSQLKFTLVNHSIVHNTTSRIPAIISAVFNGILFFAGFPLINFFPRFFLAGLVLYSALHLLVENIYDAYFRVTKLEFLAIWAILITNAVESLVLAVLIGIVLAALIFAIQYAQAGVIRAVISGSDYQSSVVRSAQEDRKLEHLGSQSLIIQLQRYIFFGSASQVQDLLHGLLEEQRENPNTVGRVQFFVFDWQHVHGIDYTAVGVFAELVKELRGLGTIVEEPAATDASRNRGRGRSGSGSGSGFGFVGSSSRSVVANHDEGAIGRLGDLDGVVRRIAEHESYTVVFTGMSADVRAKLAAEGVLELLADTEQLASLSPATASAHNASGKGQGSAHKGAPGGGGGLGNKGNPSFGVTDEKIPYAHRRVFDTLDLGMEWVEERLLENAYTIRRRWLIFESFRHLHDHARLMAQHEAFEHVLGGHLGDSLWKFVTPLEVPQGWTLCRAGHVNPHLYLLQRGRLTTYLERSDGNMVRLQSLRRGAFVNADALFVEMPLSHTIIADVDCKVLALSREKLKALEATNPEVAFEIHRNVLRHTARTRDKLARELDAVDHWMSFAREEYEQNLDQHSAAPPGGGSRPQRHRAQQATNKFSSSIVNAARSLVSSESTHGESAEQGRVATKLSRRAGLDTSAPLVRGTNESFWNLAGHSLGRAAGGGGRLGAMYYASGTPRQALTTPRPGAQDGSVHGTAERTGSDGNGGPAGIVSRISLGVDVDLGPLQLPGTEEHGEGVAPPPPAAGLERTSSAPSTPRAGSNAGGGMVEVDIMALSSGNASAPGAIRRDGSSGGAGRPSAMSKSSSTSNLADMVHGSATGAGAGAGASAGAGAGAGDGSGLAGELPSGAASGSSAPQLLPSAVPSGPEDGPLKVMRASSSPDPVPTPRAGQVPVPGALVRATTGDAVYPSSSPGAADDLSFRPDRHHFRHLSILSKGASSADSPNSTPDVSNDRSRKRVPSLSVGPAAEAALSGAHDDIGAGHLANSKSGGSGRMPLQHDGSSNNDSAVLSAPSLSRGDSRSRTSSLVADENSDEGSPTLTALGALKRAGSEPKLPLKTLTQSVSTLQPQSATSGARPAGVPSLMLKVDLGGAMLGATSGGRGHGDMRAPTPLPISQYGRQLQHNDSSGGGGGGVPALKVKLRLSETKRIDAVACFQRAIVACEPWRRLTGRTNVDFAQKEEEELQRLPRHALRETLMDMGLFPSEGELDKALRNIRARWRQRLESRRTLASSSAQTDDLEPHSHDPAMINLDPSGMQADLEVVTHSVSEREFCQARDAPEPGGADTKADSPVC